MSSGDESFHTPPSNVNSSRYERDVVSDSADSSDEYGTKLIDFNEGTKFSSSDSDSDSEEVSTESDNDLLSETKRRKIDTFLSDTKKDEDLVRVKSFNLGKSFDSNISDKMQKLNSLQELIEESPTKKLNDKIHLKLSRNKNKLMNDLVNKKINDNVIDVIIHENISNKYKDWHFMRENCSKEINSTDLLHLMESIGCEPLQDFTISDEDLDRYDSYCRILPVGYMIECIIKFIGMKLQVLSTTKEEKKSIVKFLICFILDRKVYESVDFNNVICTKIYRNIILKHLVDNKRENFIEIFEEITDKLIIKKYFIIYRLVKLIPDLKNVMISRLFDNDIKKIIVEFNSVFDSKQYECLLYLILLVYGSSLLPYGSNNTTTRYFRDCIYDMSLTATNDVELSLIKSLLNIFTKIQN